MKTLKRFIWVVAGAFVFSIVFSLIFPGKVKLLDNVRMYAQRPIIRWIGTIEVDTLTDSDISYEQLLLHIKRLTPGSVFLTRTRNYAITEFIPGYWKHSGIYLGSKSQLVNFFGKENSLVLQLDTLMNDTDFYILDSDAYGVRVHPIQDLSNMRNVSYLTNFTSFSFNAPVTTVEKFISSALVYLGREYDYDWLTEDDSEIFCTELLYHSLSSVGIVIDKRTKTFGRDIFTPDNLYTYLSKKSGRGEKFTFNGKEI